MLWDGLSTEDTSPALGFHPRGPAVLDFRQDLGRYRQLIVFVFLLNVVSSLLFIRLVNRPVYDDNYHMYDVHVYATKGVSIATIRSHRNAPGPTGYLWMVAAVRLLGGEELRDARIGVLFSWVLLIAGILAGARFTSYPRLWYGALLAVLVFPHSMEAMALVLTEGPALLFATLGALVWIEFASRPNVTSSVLVLIIIGGFLMGIAVTCRQYYLALLPAATLLALYRSRTYGRGERAKWAAGVCLSLAAAAVPVLLLILIWKGLSSPGMANGTSYQDTKLSVGLDYYRPIIAAFYIAFYLLLLTFPAMLRVKPKYRWRIFPAALLGGIAAGYFSSSILQPGPLRTILHAVARTPIAESVLLGLIVTAAIYNAFALGLLLWDERAVVLSCPPLIFALLFVVFFIGEQFGVGGNNPFFDRYVLQPAPFLGLIAFSLVPRLNFVRLLSLAALVLVSQVMLWRYAFGM